MTRYIFGPDLAILGPEEQFTLVNLSGSTPKKKIFFKLLQLI